jgi:hypothetical protein
MGRLKVKAPKADFNPGTKRTAPVLHRSGPQCNVVEGCKKLAHYVHGKWAGCGTPEHKEIVFAMCRKVRRAEKVVLPEVDFEPEDSLAEAAELAEKIG